MLITSAEELQRYLPSSVYDDTDSLVVLTERAERKHLIPVLGEDLYAYLTTKYNFYKDSYDGITPDLLDEDTWGSLSTEDQTIVRLLRLCQSAVAYFTVADNAGQLSLSFNQGNGLAQVNTDGYTAASEDALKRFLGDVWHQARQDVDDICRMLEKIAQEYMTSTSTTSTTASKSPAKANVMQTMINLWESSEWFYFQGDLLLTTAREASRYMTKEELPFSYKEYVDLQGELRTRQEANIAPELGDTLMDALVRSQYDNSTAIDSTKGAKVLHLLRMSLMNFVRWNRTDKSKYENDARLFLVRAIEVMQGDEDSFRPYIEDSPIYIKTAEEIAAETTETDTDTTDDVDMVFGTTDDSIFNPFGR